MTRLDRTPSRRDFLAAGLATTAGVLGPTAAAAAPAATPSRSSPRATALANPFEQEGQWYKAALHVHTTTSDGDVDVATRLAQYRQAGYHVVAITDHGKTNDLSGHAEEGFLPISGMEAHPKTGTGAPTHHFVCLNLPHPFEFPKELPAQALIDKVVAAGGKVIYAHPYWSAHTLEEMTEVSGYVALEVFNAVCHLRWNKGFGAVHWDQLLNKGKLLGAVATDDVHKTGQSNRGWTMIRAKSLDAAAIMESIGNGGYYASCGPVIEDCRIDGGVIRIATSPVKQVNFFFDGAAGGHVVEADAGQTLTKAQWSFGGEKRRYRWIRVEVVDPAGNHAWTNPLMV